mmetsp:Transcript_26977/g.55194  ORF Transcript_26977/g.55194 Transcript_26977/m.55194 type:complete len:266 (+) Transcript_26977:367-1164(+)
MLGRLGMWWSPAAASRSLDFSAFLAAVASSFLDFHLSSVSSTTSRQGRPTEVRVFSPSSLSSSAPSNGLGGTMQKLTPSAFCHAPTSFFSASMILGMALMSFAIPSSTFSCFDAWRPLRRSLSFCKVSSSRRAPTASSYRATSFRSGCMDSSRFSRARTWASCNSSKASVKSASLVTAMAAKLLRCCSVAEVSAHRRCTSARLLVMSSTILVRLRASRRASSFSPTRIVSSLNPPVRLFSNADCSSSPMLRSSQSLATFSPISIR